MALFEGLAARIELRASAIAEEARRLGKRAWAEFPDVHVHRDGDDLVISGRGIVRCWLTDIRLRFVFRGLQ